MNSYDIARWLNFECTDEEFVEVFAYIDMMRDGRRVNKEDLTKGFINNQFNINQTLDKVKRVVEEITYGENICTSAWWKN